AGVLPPTDSDPGVQPTGNRVEGLCAAYQLDKAQGLVKVNVAYFTKNKSPDWQNMHKPHAQAINGGAAALVQDGYDPNATNTKTYGMVLGPNCDIQSAQTLLFANTNDNLGGLWDADRNTYADTNGVTKACGGRIGDGAGDDDVWVHCTTTTATGQPGAAAYTIKPDFKVVIDTQEARSRGTTSLTPFPNMMLAVWASGNTNPPNNIRLGLVNTATGVPDNQRIVWRQTIAQRNGNIHFTTPSMVPITDATGNPTNRFIVSYVRVDTTNRGGKQKGRTSIQTVPLEVSQTGLTLLDLPVQNLFELPDAAHPGMTRGVYGVDSRPVAFLFDASITD